MSTTKQQKNSVEDDLICPISLALPFDPVTAEDGRVYERSAIEEYIKTKWGRLVSPITKKKMGKKLLPAIQHKNTIENLIEHGSITGELANDWKMKAKNKNKKEKLLKKAEDGDVRAMETVANAYGYGTGGFKQDYKLSYNWWQKAHAAGSVLGMAKEGEYLAKGIGVAKDQKKGLVYLGTAVGMGSAVAPYILGEMWADGLFGFPVDKAMARSYLEKVNSDDRTVNDLNVQGKQNAQRKLDGL